MGVEGVSGNIDLSVYCGSCEENRVRTMLSDEKNERRNWGCSCNESSGIFGNHPNFPIIGLYPRIKFRYWDDAGGDVC